MSSDVAATIVLAILIFCTMGWIPILAIGKAIAMIVRELHNCNYDDSDEENNDK